MKHKSEHNKKAVSSVASNAEKALKEAVLKIVRDRRKTGDPVIVWRGGRVVKADPKKILAR